MSILQDVQKMAIIKRPVIKPGYTVRVHQRIKEGNKERIQVFEGLVIKVNSGFGADKTFTVRKVVGGIGVEKIFALYSPMISKIEVKKKSKVRRAKLYYMRKLFGKSARMKDTLVSEQEMEDFIEEAVEAEAEKAAEEGEETAETTEETTEKAEETPQAEEPKEEVKEQPEEESPAAEPEKAEEPKKEEE